MPKRNRPSHLPRPFCRACSWRIFLIFVLQIANTVTQIANTVIQIANTVIEIVYRVIQIVDRAILYNRLHGHGLGRKGLKRPRKAQKWLFVSLKHVVGQRVMGRARSSVIDEGLEDVTVRPHPEQELAVRDGPHAPPSLLLHAPVVQVWIVARSWKSGSSTSLPRCAVKCWPPAEWHADNAYRLCGPPGSRAGDRSLALGSQSR